MERKLKDNISFECKLRRERDQGKKKMENLMGSNSNLYRKLVKKCKEDGIKKREIYSMKYKKKLDFLVKKYGKREVGLDELEIEDQEMYWNASVFNEDDMRPMRMKNPVIVCGKNEEIKLNEDELSLLRLGPKFCEYTNLNDEDFEVEVEQAIVKFKCETMNEDEDGKHGIKNEDPAEIAMSVLFSEDGGLFTSEELEKINAECEEERKLEEARMRTTFDAMNKTLNMGNRRTTDLKGNSRTILPKESRKF